MTAAILVSCSTAADQRKQEIQQKIEQLNKQIENRTDQLTRLREQRKDLIVKFKASFTRDLSDAEMNTKVSEFQKQQKSLEIRENQYRIAHLKDKLKIEKLKQQYAGI